MNRLKQVIDFINFEVKNNYTIEPDEKLSAIKERLFDVIDTYNPKVIVKAGIGSGKILHDIALKYNSYIVVVEPSLNAIDDFIHKNINNKQLENIKFINGDFHDFPIDYNVIDLLICIDYLDFFDSSNIIDEFKRVLQFNGIFFFSGVVLNENDIEGIYDDFIRKIFPLHNDYYLPDDLKTFLNLKEFTHLKSMQLKFNKNLKTLINYYCKIFSNISENDALEFIESQKNTFVDIVQMDEDLQIPEPYFIGVFVRNKPK